jgi:glycosyltransferase involved in cell wall biosynthesis
VQQRRYEPRRTDGAGALAMDDAALQGRWAAHDIDFTRWATLRRALPSGTSGRPLRIEHTMPKISTSIIALNQESKIADAIASVLWTDEIVVADSNSADATAAIAEHLGARVVQIPYTTFSELRNGAADACSHEWILSLDTDERCTPALRDEILTLLASGPDCDAYYIPRRNYFMGRWIKGSGWYPNYRQPQLYRKGMMRYTRIIHEAVEMQGANQRIGKLDNAMWQFPFENFAEILHKADRYSTEGARMMVHKRVSLGSALGHAIWAFIKHYIFKVGFIDGWAGFVIAFGNFEGTFYRYAKRYEQLQDWRPPPSEPLRRD